MPFTFVVALHLIVVQPREEEEEGEVVKHSLLLAVPFLKLHDDLLLFAKYGWTKKRVCVDGTEFDVDADETHFRVIALET